MPALTARDWVYDILGNYKAPRATWPTPLHSTNPTANHYGCVYHNDVRTSGMISINRALQPIPKNAKECFQELLQAKPLVLNSQSPGNSRGYFYISDRQIIRYGETMIRNIHQNTSHSKRDSLVGSLMGSSYGSCRVPSRHCDVQGESTAIRIHRLLPLDSPEETP